MAVLNFMEPSRLIDLLQGPARDGWKVSVANNQIVAGADPLKPTHVIDFAREQIAPLHQSHPETFRLPSTLGSDAGGKYQIECDGKTIASRSLKEALKAGLTLLEKARPGTLEKLSKIKPYSKRIVSRNKQDLFDSKHLVEDFSEELVNGWWMGTNNSTQEVRAWLERAVQCAELRWGQDFRAKF